SGDRCRRGAEDFSVSCHRGRDVPSATATIRAHSLRRRDGGIVAPARRHVTRTSRATVPVVVRNRTERRGRPRVWSLRDAAAASLVWRELAELARSTRGCNCAAAADRPALRPMARRRVPPRLSCFTSCLSGSVQPPGGESELHHRLRLCLVLVYLFFACGVRLLAQLSYLH